MICFLKKAALKQEWVLGWALVGTPAGPTHRPTPLEAASHGGVHKKKLRPRRIARLNISIVWQLTQAEEEATGTTESWKDECSANPAPSGGAPDLFE